MNPLRVLALGFVLTALTVCAQTATSFKKDDAAVYYRATPADSVKGQNTISKQFLVNRLPDYGYYVQASADSIVRSGTVDFVLFGSIDGNKRYPLDTITWSVSSADTTVIFNSGSTKVGYTYIGVSLTTKAAQAKSAFKDFIRVKLRE
ncbi:MAG: hypothetical protein HC896_00295 [Bacteroidales bacterium]|nr:hypothetical protein [Bacteroidales bacterium]